jgi:chorismate synthase
MKLNELDIQVQLNRRRPGQSKLTTPRNEADKIIILSGTESGLTLGTPIAMMVHNEDQRPHDYGNIVVIPRPSHADYTYAMKYGINASSGGGRASARETIARVASGAIAEKWLKEVYGVDIVAWVSAVGDISSSADLENDNSITRDDVDKTLVKCPDAKVAAEMEKVISSALADKDSIGGIITCVIRNVPLGLGEPCFDKLEALLAHAMLSIPATKGFEVGSGFAGTKLKGSQHNDMFCSSGGQDRSISAMPSFNETEQKNSANSNNGDIKLKTVTNRSGGIQGGISNGENIIIRVAFKPPATIGKAQETVDFNGDNVVLEAKGRHDPCVVPRAVPIVEAMVRT